MSSHAGESPHWPHNAERRLFARLADDPGPAARDAIVRQFMPLARQLAHRYRTVEDVEDLEQVAAIGLLKAIERFEPERGYAFTTFAFPTILGELKRHLRDYGWSVRPPRAVQELVGRIEPRARDLSAALGRPPSMTELAHAVGSTTEQVLDATLAATGRRAISLDQPRDNSDEPRPRGMEIAIEDPGYAMAEDADELHALLRRLDDRQRLVLHLRFREDRTQTEIAELMGVSQMQISRMIRTTLQALQTAADERPPTTPDSPADVMDEDLFDSLT